MEKQQKDTVGLQPTEPNTLYMERQAVRRMMRRAQEGQQIPQKKKDKGQER